MVDIVGYEGIYGIERDGRVFSYRRNRYLTPRKHVRGYLHFSLWSNGVGKNYLAHRLVADAYIPHSPELTIVNHKDFDQHNNVVENLEWCDQQHNVNHAVTNGHGRGKGLMPVHSSV